MGRRATTSRRISAASEGFALDTGALIALEQGDGRTVALLDRALDAEATIIIPAGVVAQAWRGDARQHRLHLLLADELVEVVPLDLVNALAVGTLLSRAGLDDVIDASLVIAAKHGNCAVITSDPGDVARLDETLQVIVV